MGQDQHGAKPLCNPLSGSQGGVGEKVRGAWDNVVGGGRLSHRQEPPSPDCVDAVLEGLCF